MRTQFKTVFWCGFLALNLVGCGLGTGSSSNGVSSDCGGGITSKGCLTWVRMTGGSFLMGTPDNAIYTQEKDEFPSHQVAVNAFEILKTEVTIAQYKACVKSGTCSAPLAYSTDTNDQAHWCNWNVPARDNHPVNCVDWSQAVAFCQAAGGRLPSEAEWEYAARDGGKAITFPWGDEAADCNRANMQDPKTNIQGCGDISTHAACSDSAGMTSSGKLCDMAGNVYEWVQDWYHNTYQGAPTDGSAWENPAGQGRVRRGGSWANVDLGLRVSNRTADYPNAQANAVGFRCVR
jgi:formylglycine-generating enzyme required for sulfatase activity